VQLSIFTSAVDCARRPRDERMSVSIMGESSTRILIVDDDKDLLREVSGYLSKQGYEVDQALDGGKAMSLVESKRPDLVILDITLQESNISKKTSIDGIEILRRVREMGSTPILMLSATSIPSVKVMALHIGADDYITKPFDLPELHARVEAILRRARGDGNIEKELNFQRLRLSPGERQVWKDGKPIDLTGIEFDILYTLARRPNHVFTRERLLEMAWKEPSYSILKVIDVHIGHLRQKIEDTPAKPAFIVTVRGTGYKFEDAVA
jgi:two-component system alkaline phosphatase synthesis response regulator PhoP